MQQAVQRAACAVLRDQCQIRRLLHPRNHAQDVLSGQSQLDSSIEEQASGEVARRQRFQQRSACCSVAHMQSQCSAWTAAAAASAAAGKRKSLSWSLLTGCGGMACMVLTSLLNSVTRAPMSAPALSVATLMATGEDCRCP